jgi:hypothetical protein
MNDSKLWAIPIYSEKELKIFQKKYSPKFILIDFKKVSQEQVSQIKGLNIPYRYFEIKENNFLELWNENTKITLEDINKLPEQIGRFIKLEK